MMKFVEKFSRAVLVSGILLSLFGAPVQNARAAANLTIEPLTWNVIGLDSNNVSVGPNNFPIGARVCNTGDSPATGVSVKFVWDVTDPLIYLRPTSLTEITTASIAPGPSNCVDYYFEVEIARNPAAYDNTARYHIEVSSNETATVSTPTPREIYVEYLISQSRNSTTDVQLDGGSVAPGGTMTLMLGETYDITLLGSTATNGYEQIESYINFPNTIFQINSVSSVYAADDGTDPDASTKIYADGCDWENDPDSPNYRSCLNTGKYGGDIEIDYNVTIIGGEGTSSILNTLIYDFSGSSYHYNSDFSVAGRIAVIVDPASITIDKSFAPDPASLSGVSTLTFTLSNPNDVAVSGANFVDDLPSSPGVMSVADPAVYSTSSCGTPTFSPGPGDTTLNFANGTIPANGTCTVSVRVETTATGLYTNTSGNLYIGTVDTGNNATDTLTVNNDPGTPAPICGFVLGEWTVPSTATNPPDLAGGHPTTQALDVTTATAAAGTGLGPTSIVSNQGYNDSYSWKSDGGFETGAFNPAQNNYFVFRLDTEFYTDVTLSFWAWRTQNGPKDLYIYYGTSGTPPGTLKTSFTEAAGTGLTAARTWTHFTVNFTGNTSTSGDTYFYIFGANSVNSNPGSDLHIDLITFNGCQIPALPTLTKSFLQDPIAVNGTSTLRFTLSNPNTVALTSAAFADTYPAGLVNHAAPNGATTCAGGTVTAAAGGSSVSFSGGTIPAGGSCTVSVNVTAPSMGAYTNVSGFISTLETGANTGPDGFGTDTLTVLGPPAISKRFSPNPILVNETSTLTFTITNPNQDVGLTGVQFTDTYPSTDLVNATPANWSTDCTGGTVTAVDGAGSVSLAGASIPGGESCTVTVDVTSSVEGSYANTSGSVSAAVAGPGNTASDTLVVEPIRPSLSLLKQVAASPSGPWTSFVAVDPGEPVYYRFTVENTGDVPLSTVSVSDPALAGSAVDPAGCSWSDPLPVAAPGPDLHFEICDVGSISAVSGSHPNTATASGSYGGSSYNSDPSTASYGTTALTIAKSAAEAYFTAEGDTLHYSYLVTNTGFASLLGPVVVNDDLAADESCSAVSTAVQTAPPGAGDGDNWLDPGEQIACSATYTVDADDVAAGEVTNVATAAAGGETSPADTVTVPIVVAPTVTKLFSPDSIDSGTSTTLTITIANANPVELTGVAFTDSFPGDVEVASPANATTFGCGTPTFAPAPADTSLDFSGGSVAASGSCTVTVDVTAFTAGTVTNTTSLVRSNEAPDSGTASDDLTVLSPALTIVKSGVLNDDDGTAGVSAGDTISYTFTVENTGNVTLTNVTVSDPLVSVSGGPTTLDVGETDSTTFTGSYTITQADIDAGQVDNTATADSDESGPATDEETTLLGQSPALNLTKSSTTAAVTAAGEVVPYTYVVTNTGNVTLINVTLVDNNTDSAPVCVPALPAVMAPGAILNCTAQHTVTDPEFNAGGNLSNTATADSDQVGPVQEVLDIPIVRVFDPPFGIKVYDDSGLPLLRWTMVWINDSNAAALDAEVFDPIPAGTTFFSGPVCSEDGTDSVTTLCNYNGVTNQIEWAGTIYPDPGDTTAAAADNEITITYLVSVPDGLDSAVNQATLNADLNDDGTIDAADGEIAVADAQSTWTRSTLPGIPETGFAPGVFSEIPRQSVEKGYTSLGSVWIEIPALGLKTTVLGVPIVEGQWDVTWLGNQVGWLEGTAFPAYSGNSVMTAHVYLPSGLPGPFVGLGQLKWDDQIVVHAFGQQYVYLVRSNQLVHPDNSYAMRHEEASWLTLITCKGYNESRGQYDYRVLVRAAQVDVMPEYYR